MKKDWSSFAQKFFAVVAVAGLIVTYHYLRERDFLHVVFWITLTGLYVFISRGWGLIRRARQQTREAQEFIRRLQGQ